MARQEAAKQAAGNQEQKLQRALYKGGAAVGSRGTPERHFMVAEYKVSIDTRNRSFELGYN